MKKPATLIVLVAFTACGEPTTPAQPSFDWQGQGLVGSAIGRGTVDVTQPPPAVGEAVFEFEAIRTANRGAFGTFHMVRQRAGFRVEFSGEVTCLTFDPANNRAWVGGVVTANNSNDPNHTLAIHQPGRDVWFRVVDPGETPDALPDRSTVYGFEGAGGIITSAEYCEKQPWTAGDVNAFVVTSGGIQVHAR